MKKIIIFVATLSLLLPLGSEAKTLITVVDQQGQPLADAIIELQSETVVPAQPDSSPLVMDQVDKSFAPHVLLVGKSSLVQFPNSDDIRHHVYSFSQAKPFELKLYAGQPKEPVRFETNGVVVLGCNIHDAMVGYIYVHEHPAYKTDSQGQVWIDDDTALGAAVWLWHPRAKAGVEKRQVVAVSSLSKTEKGYQAVIDVQPAQARDSFEDVFTNAQ
ncbi:methylamine utilization protein [Pseudoalteromonas pernae]|uniref:methylamine utilization protein n=1 Tax=Pseudoalteromonas pernae TaxID=3118054 RepID=UPI0032425EF6